MAKLGWWWGTPLSPALEAEAGGSLSLRPAWSTRERVPGHVNKVTQRNPVSKKQNKTKQKHIRNEPRIFSMLGKHSTN